MKTINLCGKQKKFHYAGILKTKVINFAALIRFRAETDQILADHQQNNSQMRDIFHLRYKIHICNQQLQSSIIVSECNSANCFSIIADETTDVSATEQIFLCVRYVGINGDGAFDVKESFNGEALATTINDKLHEFGILTQAMRDQGYDGLLIWQVIF